MNAHSTLNTQYILHCQVDKRVNFNSEIGKILVSGKYDFSKACLFLNLCTCLCEVCAHVYRGQRLMLGVIFYPKLLLKEICLVPLQLLYSPYLLSSVFSSSHLSLVPKTHNSKSGLLLVAPEVPSEEKCN